MLWNLLKFLLDLNVKVKLLLITLAFQFWLYLGGILLQRGKLLLNNFDLFGFVFQGLQDILRPRGVGRAQYM